MLQPERLLEQRIGNEAPHLDGLVSLELLKRDFRDSACGVTLACPALRQLRLVACANCRGDPGLGHAAAAAGGVVGSHCRPVQAIDAVEMRVEIKYSAFVLNRRVVIHAIDAMHPTH